jgi:predicted nucleic acid-binding protein
VTYLLDISALMALLWETHVHNKRVTKWQESVPLAVCPLTELGFLRISTQPSFGLSVAEARKVLNDWRKSRKPLFVQCDMEALSSDSPSAGSKMTDFYLASLAAQHGMELATLDEGISHKTAFLIPT